MYNVLSAAASGRVNRFVYIGPAAGPNGQGSLPTGVPMGMPIGSLPSESWPAGRDFLFCYLSIKWWHNFFVLFIAGWWQTYAASLRLHLHRLQTVAGCYCLRWP